MSRVQEVDGSMVNGSMGYNLPTYKWDMLGLYPIDPNFLGHPISPHICAVGRQLWRVFRPRLFRLSMSAGIFQIGGV